MNKTEMLKALEATVPTLAGKLHIERVLYKKEANKAYMSFLSDVLVGQQEFLLLERRLRELFPQLTVALRVASPSLGEDFLSDVNKYKSVLTDFLRRQSPALSAWIGDTGWSVDDGRILLTCPDKIALQFFKTHKLDEKLSQAVYDIFRVRVPVSIDVCGERDAWVQKMREERGFSFPTKPAAAPMPDDEPPWDENAMMSMAGMDAPAAAPAAKQPPKPKAALKPEKPAWTPPPPPPKGSTVIKGRAIGDKPVPIGELGEDSGIVVIEGIVTGVNEPRELKGGETVLVTFALYDDTSTIYCKCFYQYRTRRAPMGETPPPPSEEERQKVNDQIAQIKNGMRMRLRGDCRMDTFLGELSVGVRDMQEMPKIERKDTCDEKRIELHMHTNMSTMDGMTDVGDLIKQAAKWGHSAVAVTDHGAAQAFPGAFGAAKKNNIKLIPGCEGYLCDLVPIVRDADDRPLDTPIVVLDFETTGLSHTMDRIIEVGAVKIENGVISDELSILCDPGVPLKPKISELTGITDLMLRGKESPAEGVQKLLDFIGDCPVAAHNAPFDMGMLEAECERMGVSCKYTVLDTLVFSRKLYPQQKSHKLGNVCRMLGVSLKNAHRAVHDAAATAQCLVKMLEEAAKKGAKTFKDIDSVISGETIGDSYHIVLLCKSQKGMQNLNHLISDSNLRYFYRHPNMPRHLINEYREGLILGSACEAGELFEAVVNNRPDAELEKIASWYDYLEIQPIGNNQFMIRNGTARDEEQLRDFNRKIVALGEKMGKPVVATGDVHFLHPEDAIYRTIIQAGLGFDDCDEQAPLYFKTTNEMLEEFSYLGPQKAYEVVIQNPKLIADQVEDLRLFPKHPDGKDTFQPFWPEAADDIQNRSWNTAKALYGDPLPELVQKRLEKELGSIIGYGFGTLYSIAQKLVSKSLSDGYFVGSRGSVGSSFVATMCGITEVNPLPPHYRCDHCHKMFLTPPELASVGVDLPDKNCEICGNPLAKDGFDIPFEVFLGFKGDKVPDIDLNFSGEYQPRAHAYVEELFGHNYVFRAGTISGLAEKTAYGFAAKYCEERGIRAGRAHKERLAAGCVGVKRTTGQHPGGIVVLPKEYDICQFTAIQHPADDIEGSTITTHYDFNSMHDILVKLDCLGHDDPTVLHRLEELTGINYKEIPLDDPEVRSLFASPKALGLTVEELMWETGTLGIPEFGTSFVRGMLMETRPTTMEELVRISGLSHGTDVWLGNAQDIINSGKAKLAQCFCTRDDIMNFLISKGMQEKMSFDIMESVRKGRGLKPEWEEAMQAHDVPDWAIESCHKIKYMFPRGHAVAYVTSSLRVAWYKVHRPQAYYAAYFTIRGDGFDAGRMLLSKETLRDLIIEFQNREEKMSVREKQEENAYRMLLEMQLRGIRMLPLDLYKSDLKNFLIEGNDLRCPFTSVSGFPEAAALGIINSRDPERPYISVEDLKARAHLGDGVLETLRSQGALEGLPATSQVDLFSLMM
ncbi:MAG: PolC-type DNA polymerase III [Clostridia bacterium]|nr:PolC-type DNA polymerase III [Clostridia bacterium]